MGQYANFYNSRNGVKEDTVMNTGKKRLRRTMMFLNAQRTPRLQCRQHERMAFTILHNRRF